jgi:hypothetical protein
MGRQLAAKARRVAAALRAEYEAGRRGDDSPAEPVWATPAEQWQRLRQLVGARAVDGSTPVVEPDTPATDSDAADEVVSALGRVDWTAVRAATTERTTEAAAAMKAMAADVDWAKVQPVAAQISSALIAAVASGQLGIGGPLGRTLARTIVNDGGLAHRVGTSLERQRATLPPDFRNVIDATSSDS